MASIQDARVEREQPMAEMNFDEHEFFTQKHLSGTGAYTPHHEDGATHRRWSLGIETTHWHALFQQACLPPAEASTLSAACGLSAGEPAVSNHAYQRLRHAAEHPSQN